ncbi:hypothetical protein PAPHI01_1307 [Pancytospora philotis]|nr:hypothetical protein PAPHI01_1307 [Pancytospora philotis]
MGAESMHTQKIYLNDLYDESTVGERKASRIGLRTLRDAYPLKAEDVLVPAAEHGKGEDVELRRVTAYCTAEAYNLKDLYKLLRRNSRIEKGPQIYFGECLHAIYRADDRLCDLFFTHYGAVVMWGLEENEEQGILKMISCIEKNPYDMKAVEIEKFSFGIAKHAQIVNDQIFLHDDNPHTKMVIGTAMAQSVKLDYFEELVDNTIDTVKDLPDEVEKEGKVGKKRQDLLRIMGKLHKLGFNLYLVSNILSEPEFVWEHSAFSPMYESCIRYLDIKSRADLLNKRCQTINGMLEILSENITTRNSETLERTMTWLIGISAGFGFLQCAILFAVAYKFFSSP